MRVACPAAFCMGADNAGLTMAGRRIHRCAGPRPLLWAPEPATKGPRRPASRKVARYCDMNVCACVRVCACFCACACVCTLCLAPPLSSLDVKSTFVLFNGLRPQRTDCPSGPAVLPCLQRAPRTPAASACHEPGTPCPCWASCHVQRCHTLASSRGACVLPCAGATPTPPPHHTCPP